MATYGSQAGVEALNSHFTGGYTTATHPTAAAVGVWLAEGYATLNMALLKAGYAVPVTRTQAAYDILTRLNNLYAAAQAERSVNIGPAADTVTRGDSLWKEYREGLIELLTGDLTLIGLTLTASAPARRSLRSVQMRHYDGYAANADTAAEGEYA